MSAQPSPYKVSIAEGRVAEAVPDPVLSKESLAKVMTDMTLGREAEELQSMVIGVRYGDTAEEIQEAMRMGVSPNGAVGHMLIMYERRAEMVRLFNHDCNCKCKEKFLVRFYKTPAYGNIKWVFFII